MSGARIRIHTAFLVLLPLVVAWFGLSVLSALGLILLMLLWRWMISLSTFVMPEKVPALVLDTILASHFVEKVRWNMDRTGIEYIENASAGTLGAFFGGRTVPRLNIRTGAVRSQIGNSAEILRYLWGAYSADDDANVTHLRPTPERVALERRFDRYGRNLQVWVYSHVLHDRDLTLHLWGGNCPTIAAWQRAALRLLYPLLAALIRRLFRIKPENVEKAKHHIDELLSEMDAMLADGRASILGKDERNYTDYTFAALTGLWLQPPAYGGGKANNVLVTRDRVPEEMRADIERWSDDNARVVSWVQRLYETERDPQKHIAEERSAT